MALTPDFDLRVIHSDASITDMVAFHAALREIEVSDVGMLYPPIHTYKEVPLGGGALFPALAFVNGWTLQLPAGSWVVSGGNLDVTINPVAGCYVKMTQAAAYAVTTVGGSGPTPPTAEEVATAVWAHTTASDLLDRVQLAEAILRNKQVTDPVTGIMTGFDVDGVTPLLQAQLYEGIDTLVPYRGAGAERRERLA